MPTARKAAATPSAEPEPTAKKSAAKKAPATSAAAPASAEKATSTTKKAPAKRAAKSAAPVADEAKPAEKAKQTTAVLPIAPGEEAWTKAEVDELREDLDAEVERLRAGIKQAEEELTELLQEGGDGAGRDPADVGSANFERDQEMSLHANLREMLEQTEHAIERLDAGTYGLCEVCGEPIGKGRLQAFPRATMCVTCKQREERR